MATRTKNELAASSLLPATGLPGPPLQGEGEWHLPLRGFQFSGAGAGAGAGEEGWQCWQGLRARILGSCRGSVSRAAFQKASWQHESCPEPSWLTGSY